MKNIVIEVKFENSVIQFEDNGWFNATVAATHFGKIPVEWLRLPATKEYIEVLESTYGKIPYVKTSKARIDRGGGTWLHPKLAIRFAQWLDIRFAVWCDMQIDNLLRGNIKTKEDWKRVRHEASSSNKLMNAMLNLIRFEHGKDTCSYHYMNEAKMINFILKGQHKGIDRNTLSIEELNFLAKLEERNALLIAKGIDYKDRKKELSKFIQKLTTKKLK